VITKNKLEDSRLDTRLRRVRTMIVEDSRVVREFLTHIIGRDPRLEVAAVVTSAEEALRVLHQVMPDVISMDICLPGMDGFIATQRIMAERPTPIVVVAANVGSDDRKITINALRAGALSVLEKPGGSTHEDYESFAERLCTQLAIMSQVKVITQRIGRRTQQASTAPSATSVAVPRNSTTSYEMLGVVASTGGPNALVEIINGLDNDFRLPILLVQHITSSFSTAFAAWLDDVCPLRVVQARHGERPGAGHVYVPPADRHLTIHNRRLHLSDAPLVSMQRPSGTVLLRSMAADLGARTIGVLLTGMGEDGAEGLLAIREAGGHTIAEDESTAVVYGMPGAAVALGAVRESLPLHGIAPRLRHLARC